MQSASLILILSFSPVHPILNWSTPHFVHVFCEIFVLWLYSGLLKKKILSTSKQHPNSIHLNVTITVKRLIKASNRGISKPGWTKHQGTISAVGKYFMTRQGAEDLTHLFSTRFCNNYLQLLMLNDGHNPTHLKS